MPLVFTTSALIVPLNSGFTTTVILGVSLIHTQQETQLKSESKTVNSVQPDTLRVDSFDCARISSKQSIAAIIRGTTPRTVRWSEVEPCRKWGNRVPYWLDTMQERAVGMTLI